MCFNQELSFVFAAFGWISAYVVYRKTNNLLLSLCVLFFALMETLQGFQYIWIDQCDNKWNQFLTFLGLVHLTLQPFFAHLLVYSLLPPSKTTDKKIYQFLLKFIFIGSTFFFIRFVLGYFGLMIYEDTSGFQTGYDVSGNKNGFDSQCGLSNEWIRGEKLCTFTGRTHLAWSIPLASTSYYLPSVFLHFYNMFVPFFLIKGYKYIWVYGCALYLTGPLLASMFSDDYMEQGSIWCFFSMFQVTGVIAFVYFFDDSLQPIKKKRGKSSMISEKEL